MTDVRHARSRSPPFSRIQGRCPDLRGVPRDGKHRGTRFRFAPGCYSNQHALIARDVKGGLPRTGLMPSA